MESVSHSHEALETGRRDAAAICTTGHMAAIKPPDMVTHHVTVLSVTALTVAHQVLCKHQQLLQGSALAPGSHTLSPPPKQAQFCVSHALRGPTLPVAHITHECWGQHSVLLLRPYVCRYDPLGAGDAASPEHLDVLLHDIGSNQSRFEAMLAWKHLKVSNPLDRAQHARAAAWCMLFCTQPRALSSCFYA